MADFEQIQNEIKGLTQEALAKFRNWFLEYDSNNWDTQIENDSKSGKLDLMAEEKATRTPKKLYKSDTRLERKR